MSCHRLPRQPAGDPRPLRVSAFQHPSQSASHSALFFWSLKNYSECSVMCESYTRMQHTHAHACADNVRSRCLLHSCWVYGCLSSVLSGVMGRDEVRGRGRSTQAKTFRSTAQQWGADWPCVGQVREPSLCTEGWCLHWRWEWETGLVQIREALESPTEHSKLTQQERRCYYSCVFLSLEGKIRSSLVSPYPI